MLSCIFLALILTRCSKDDVDEIIVIPPTSGDITYANNIQSIISSNCLSCHGSTPSNGAPMSLTTFTNVKNATENRGLIGLIEDGTMPPTGNLSVAQVQLFKTWRSEGYKE